MANLPLYDPYADADHQVNYNGHSPYIGIDRSSQGPYVQETENRHQFVNRMFSSRLAKRGKTLSFRGIGPFNLRSTCICLHLLLVLVHVVLFFVWWYHLEHRVIVPLSRSGNISSAIVVTSQLLVIIYTVVLVGIMQQLTTRGILLKYQTLTATHDESAAWAGLGSALLVLWSQTRIAASVIGSLSAAIYLMGISVLHISTPSLFNLQVFENLNALTISTQIAMPNISNEIASELSTFWNNAAPLMPFLARGDLDNIIGVQNGTLYDILDVNNSTGNVAVGATSFNVTCGSLPNITVTGVPGDSSDPSWNFNMTVSENSPFNSGGLPYSFGITSPNVMGYINPYQANFSAIQLGRNMMFYIMGPAIVTDSSGNVSSRASINPPMVLSGYNMVYTDDNGKNVSSLANETIVVSDITIIGCTLSTIKQSAIVDASTRKLVSVNPTSIKTKSEWLPWNPLVLTNDSKYVLDPQIDGWKQMFMPGVSTGVGQTLTGPLPTAAICAVDNCGNVVHFSQSYIDLGSQYVMEKLGLYPQYNAADNSAKPSYVKLDDFENALANMAASMYWAASNVQPDHWFQVASAGVSNVSDVHLPVLRGSALAANTETHLNINLFSLTLGFVTSLVLLGTAAVLIRRLPYFANTAFDTSGVLRDMWMAYRHPHLRSRFLQVVEPTTDNLRAIGMVQMQLAEGWSPVPMSESGNS